MEPVDLQGFWPLSTASPSSRQPNSAAEPYFFSSCCLCSCQTAKSSFFIFITSLVNGSNVIRPAFLRRPFPSLILSFHPYARSLIPALYQYSSTFIYTAPRTFIASRVPTVDFAPARVNGEATAVSQRRTARLWPEPVESAQTSHSTLVSAPNRLYIFTSRCNWKCLQPASAPTNVFYENRPVRYCSSLRTQCRLD
jgi:hypothetical protein